jgi:circadian clock protein KaiB
MTQKRRESHDPIDRVPDLDKAIEGKSNQHYVLRLFVTGLTPRSRIAIENIKKICEENLKGRYDLEVIDIYQQPEEIREEQILASPTLIKKLPLPLRKVIGDMSNTDRILVGLDLKKRIDE